jgi:hypothetical protein
LLFSPFLPPPMYIALQARSLLLCLFCGLSQHFGMRRESRTFCCSMQPPGLALYSTTTQQLTCLPHSNNIKLNEPSRFSPAAVAPSPTNPKTYFTVVM